MAATKKTTAAALTRAENKALAFIRKSTGSAIAPPDKTTIEKTMELAEALAKVNAKTTQLQGVLSMTSKIVELVNLL